MSKIDLLGPVSRNNAQIVENAFEEEQPGYAIESLKISFQLGMYPTRDLFLAILAIILSSDDLSLPFSSTSIRTKKRRKNQRASLEKNGGSENSVRKYQRFDWQDIERSTIVSAIDLIDDLVQTAPNAIKRYLPPFPEAGGKSEEQKSPSCSGILNQELEIEWQKEERNWLRRMLYIDGRSSPEDSRVSSRNRTPSMIENPIIRLAAKMLDCNTIFDLLALDPEDMTSEKMNAGTNHSFTRRNKISREGDDEEQADAQDAELLKKYDRPGTWILLKHLTSLWSAELESIQAGEGVKSKKALSSHLALQVLSIRSAEESNSRMRGKGSDGSTNTELGHALDLIKVGLIPSFDKKALSKNEEISRRTKCFAAGTLLELFIQLGVLGGFDTQSLIRGMSSNMERFDSFAFERLEEMNILVMENTFLARAAIRCLSNWPEDDAPSPWDKEMMKILNDCLELSQWNTQQREFLRWFKKGFWLLHKVDWEYEEGLEIWRSISDLPSDQQDGVRKLLSESSWQLSKHIGHLPKSRGRPKKHADTKLKEVFIIAARVKYRVIDRLVTQMQMQRAILECMERFFVPLVEDNRGLLTVSSFAVEQQKKQTRKDVSAIRNCFTGMERSYRKASEEKISQEVENGDETNTKKRRRPMQSEEEEEEIGREKASKEMNRFSQEWGQIEKKIKRMIMMMEAHSNHGSCEIEISSSISPSSSDLTDLSQLK